MSIILDALKKMEKEGEQKGVPAIASVTGSRTPWRKKGLIFPLAASALAVILFVAVIRLGQREVPEETAMAEGGGQPPEGGVTALQGERSSRPEDPGAERPAIPPESASPVPVRTPVHLPDSGGGSERKRTEETAARQAAVPVVRTPVAASPMPPVQEIAALEDRPLTESATTVEEEDDYDGTVLSVDELPGDLRPDVADLRMSAHVYSDDPAFRRVAVNDALKREGDVAAAGLVVEEITERGAVFRYRGYRFRMDSH